MLPDLNDDGNLPPGIHSVAWTDFEVRFGTTPHRRRLLNGLKQAALALKEAGCKRLYVDGSFVTGKEQPRDFDACWDVQDVDLGRMDPVLLCFDNGRMAQKVKYGGELFPASNHAETAPTWRTFLEFFQEDKETGERKGLVLIDLEQLK